MIAGQAAAAQVWVYCIDVLSEHELFSFCIIVEDQSFKITATVASDFSLKLFSASSPLHRMEFRHLGIQIFHDLVVTII